MPILIDGYNLLHVTEIFSTAVGPGSVEKLHRVLIEFLSEALDPADVPQTTIVFDAKGRRAGARRVLRHANITVHYAARHEDADAYLDELIRQHSAPRRLVVVSSDHQVQRSARRRRAKAVDSQVWYAELLRRRRERRQTEVHVPGPPPDVSDMPRDVIVADESPAGPFPPGYLAEIQREFLSGALGPPRAGDEAKRANRRRPKRPP